MNKQNPRSGFTLVEILVVIAILAIIAAIALPVITNARNEGYKAQTIAQIRQLGLAVIQYSADAEDTLPYGHESEYFRTFPLNPPILNRHLTAPDLKAQLQPYGGKREFWFVPNRLPDPTRVKEGVYDNLSNYYYLLGPTKLSAVPSECYLISSLAGLHPPFVRFKEYLYHVLPDGSAAYVPAEPQFTIMDECAEKRWPGQTGT